MSKTGIFGGTFDPVHFGHLIVAEYAREELNLEKILFVPNASPPHKQNEITSYRHRFNMLSLAVENNPEFKISNIEADQRQKHYTYNTLLKLKEIYPGELYFIIGADALTSIKTWFRYRELLNLTSFIIFPRIAESEPQKTNNHDDLRGWIKHNLKLSLNNFHFIDIPLNQISSTLIRNRIRQNKSIRYLLPLNVDLYIREHNLYY